MIEISAYEHVSLYGVQEAQGSFLEPLPSCAFLSEQGLGITDLK